MGSIYCYIRILGISMDVDIVIIMLLFIVIFFVCVCLSNKMIKLFLTLLSLCFINLSVATQGD